MAKIPTSELVYRFLEVADALPVAPGSYNRLQPILKVREILKEKYGVSDSELDAAYEFMRNGKLIEGHWDGAGGAYEIQKSDEGKAFMAAWVAQNEAHAVEERRHQELVGEYQKSNKTANRAFIAATIAVVISILSWLFPRSPATLSLTTAQTNSAPTSEKSVSTSSTK